MSIGKVIFRVHTIQRMLERRISLEKIMTVLETGETIEDYSTEMPEPCRLLLGFQRKKPVHVVVSENIRTNDTTIVTVYIPDPNKWNKDFRSRK